jgi:hypothetical protein
MPLRDEAQRSWSVLEVPISTRAVAAAKAA